MTMSLRAFARRWTRAPYSRECYEVPTDPPETISRSGNKRVPRSKTCCNVSGKSIIVPCMRAFPPLSWWPVWCEGSRYSGGFAQRVEHFVGGWQPRRVRYVPAVDDLAVRIDDQDASSQD